MKAQVLAFVARNKFRSVVSSFAFKDWTATAAEATGERENSEETIRLIPSEYSFTMCAF